MRVTRPGRSVLIGTAFGAAFLGVAAYAAVNETIAVGTMAFSDLFGGPATVTMRRLTIAPGEVLGWHYHPGVGAYTIVTKGTLTVEDGCGGEVVYVKDQAFLEPPHRVHRGKNLGTEDVVTAQTFIVPTGFPISVSPPGPLCGPPAEKADCKDDGWMKFTHPRSFESQGDCQQYVITGR